MAAQKIGKRPSDVNKAVVNMISANAKLRSLYKSTTYEDEQGKLRPMYIMNRDGFTLLVMGFTGKDALTFKLDYINAFNEMEKTLKEDVVSKKEHLAAQEQIAIWRKTANSTLESNKSMTMLVKDLSKELLNELSNEKEVSDSVLRPKTFHKLTSEYYNCAINSFAEWLRCENTNCYASDVRDSRLVKKLEATRLPYNDPKRTVPISIALKP